MYKRCRMHKDGEVFFLYFTKNPENKKEAEYVSSAPELILLLMPELPLVYEDHGHSVLVEGLNYLLVAYRALD